MEWVSKYVDDISAGEKICLANSTSVWSQRKEERLVRAPYCEKIHDIVAKNSRAIGMKLNSAKTQLLCITAAINYEVRSTIDIEGTQIVSGDELKVLGFTMGRRPTMRPHVEAMKKKYVTRTHVIRHLKKVGFANHKLTKILCSLIRPIIEFAAQVYHHMLTEELNEEIERLQRDVLKSIYGFDTPYSTALEISNLETLESRRKTLALNFALSLEKNAKFSSWFPLQGEYRHNIREKKKYKEEFALRDRLRNSPVFSMRRMLNDHYAALERKET